MDWWRNSKFSHHRERGKLQLLNDPSQINADKSEQTKIWDQYIFQEQKAETCEGWN